MSADILALAERHVWEGEARLRRQEELVAEAKAKGHTLIAATGTELLATMRESLRLARQDLERERSRQR